MSIRRIFPGSVALMCVGLLALIGPSEGAWAAKGRAAARCKTYKVAGRKIHLCNGLNGRNGGPGPSGPQGPGGPQGPAGANGRGNVFNEPLKVNQSSTVFNQNGVKIEASCPGGRLELFVTPETASDHNIIENTVFDNFAGQTLYFDSFGVDGGTVVDMLDGDEGIHDYNGLLTVRLDPGGQITFIQWWASGGNNHPQGICFVGGTASY